MYLDVRSNLYPTRLTESMLMVHDNYQTLFEVPTFTSTNNDYRYQACFAKRTWTKSVTLCVKLYDKVGGSVKDLIYKGNGREYESIPSETAKLLI